MADETDVASEVARVLGEVHWRRADGTTGEYAGPVQELGYGIPRRDTGPGVRRALFDLAFGYVSGFPVRDILAYMFPGSFREAPVLEATADPQIAAQEPAGATQTDSGDSRASNSADGLTARVLELAQWFREQGLVGYARKVEEAVEG